MISFEAIFEQSTPNSPIVFILSPGSDPASDLMKLAERSGFGGNRLKFLAMGQGQEKVIRCWKERTLNLREVPGLCSQWVSIWFHGCCSMHELGAFPVLWAATLRARMMCDSCMVLEQALCHC